MTPSAERRLSELFVRYWDNALTAAEADELAGLLAADPQARDLFHVYCRQAVTVAELPAFTPPTVPAGAAELVEPEPLPTGTTGGPPEPSRHWTRRGVLGLVGGGLAAALTVGVAVRFSRDKTTTTTTTTIRVRNPRGEVSVQAADGRTLSLGEPLPVGAKVSTHGLGSSALLSYVNGSGVTLTGDSVVTIPDEHHLQVHQGAVCAAVPPQTSAREPLTILTTQVTLAGLSGVLITLGAALRSTEVEVHQGSVSALRPTGEPMDVVREGELLTVRADGDHRKCPTPRIPEEFAWDLSVPLPEGWHVGQREQTPEEFVVIPELWPDPYWQNTPMYQIRSNKQWTRGFFRLMSDSVIQVRYRVDVPGKGQMCFCVRTPSSTSPYTGMLEWNCVFGEQKPGEKKVGVWDWLTVRAQDMLGNMHAPQFPNPWIGFLIIFNTYDEKLGLRVAEFKVSRPGGVCPLIQDQ